MLKLIRALLFLAGLAVVILLSVANRQPVDVGFWPLPYGITVPLYWVFLFTLAVGAVLGGLAAWLSSTARRSEARRLRSAETERKDQERRRREAEEQALVAEARRKTEKLATLPPPARGNAGGGLALASSRP